MAKVNIDTMFEPIEFTLDGKDYKIENINPDLIDKVTAIDTKADGIAGMQKQFSVLTGIPEDQVRTIDIRKIKAVIELIMKAITPEGIAKNAS